MEGNGRVSIVDKWKQKHMWLWRETKIEHNDVGVKLKLMEKKEEAKVEVEEGGGY